MSHDWSAPFGGVEALDQKIREILGKGIEDQKFWTVEMPPPAPLMIQDLVELTQQVSLAQEAARRATEIDTARLEEAATRAFEAGEGIFVVTREGRVVYAEPSPFVPEQTAYWCDANNWAQVHSRLFAEWEGDSGCPPYDPNID